MKKSYKIISLILCAVMLVFTLGACGSGGSDDTAVTGGGGDISNEIEDIAAPDMTNAAKITLSGGSATVSGGSAEISGSEIIITGGGVYAVSGTLSDGSIVVNAPDEEVTLVLDGADITCSDGSPLYIYKAAKATVYLADGSENSLSDGENYAFGDEFSSKDDEEPNACLYSKSDLAIGGSGSLKVTAAFKNGVTGKDGLLISGANITVTAKNNGINGKDYCKIKKAAVTVTSGGDAIRSTNDSDENLGYITIADSTLALTAGEDGIQAETSLKMSGGSCTVISGGGSGGKLADDASAKGLKAGKSLTVLSGSYKLDCCDDAVHSNGSVQISGGEFEISTGDDGVHADENASMSGGTLNVTKGYEGFEGATVDISGGTLNIVSSDDGINAAGGNDESGFGARQDKFGGDSSYYISISGGVIKIDASGDGIDSNGDITVSGGEMYISGATNGGDSAIDCDGSAKITGGTVVAAGYSGMAQNFGSDSTQGSIMLSSANASTETITLKDSSGKTLVSYTPAKNYNNAVISTPDIVKGSTYSASVGGETTEVTMDSLIYGEGFGMGGFPGAGGMGGMQPDGDPPEGMSMPEGFTKPDGDPPAKPSGDPPEGMSMPEGMTKPQGDLPQRPGDSGNA